MKIDKINDVFFGFQYANFIVKLRSTKLFDPNWYLQQYPDVAKAGMDAAVHYLNHGAFEGRKPGPLFDEAYYLKQCTLPLNYPSAFLHYLAVGEAQGLLPCAPATAATTADESNGLLQLLQQHPFFDAAWYLQQNPDVAAAGLNAAEHYLGHGAAEGRVATARFDNQFYQSQLQGDCGYPSLFLHYVAIGEAQGLLPNRRWSAQPWWWQLPLPGALNFDTDTLLAGLASNQTVILVIPVYNAVAELIRCIDALRLHRQGIFKVVLVDDASTDDQVPALFAKLSTDGWFSCIKNPRNLGFSGSVNLGMMHAAELDASADLVLLNSDTEVTAGWLRQLRYAAYSSTNIATVTPVSNNAGAFSVPQAGENLLPLGFDIASLGRACAQSGETVWPQVPTGHGFCLYIRRAALQQVGLFDAAAFPRGYGEENDFCQRAAALGWQHLIAPRAYVYHQCSASFGSSKAELLQQGRTIIEQRYPAYPARVRAAFSAATVQSMRSRVAAICAMPTELVSQIKPRVLYVISTRSGGTPQTNQDLMQAVSAQVECFVLHCDSRILTLQHFADGVYTQLEQHQLNEPLKAISHVSAEYDRVVTAWLLYWAIELVHIRHLGWHSLGFIPLVKTLGLPVIHSFHDFYTLCPTIKLLDDQQRYCAATCTLGLGQCKHELWPEDAFSNLKHQQVYQWQQMFGTYLQHCDAFVTTNQQAKTLILSKYPLLASKPFPVIAHGRNFAGFANLAVMPKSGEKLRLLCPGHITLAKGLALIQHLALHYAEQFEIHILGDVSTELDLPANVIIHGSYSREQLFSLIANIKPHCGAVFSIWPETWCHTLTELWAAGIPVLGLPFGAVAERIQQHQAGWVLHNAEADAIATLLLADNFSSQWQQKHRAVQLWQQQVGTTQNCQQMAAQYLALYQQFLPFLRAIAEFPVV